MMREQLMRTVSSLPTASQKQFDNTHSEETSETSAKVIQTTFVQKVWRLAGHSEICMEDNAHFTTKFLSSKGKGT